MDTIKDFAGLSARFASLEPRRRVAVVCPDDEPTIEVVRMCLSDGLAYIYMVARADRADAARAIAAAYPSDCSLSIAPDAAAASEIAVRMVHDGRADVLFKGNVNTDVLLHAVLNKEYGLLPAGSVLSHVALAEIPGFDRLLMFSDAAVIPEPGLDQLDAILRADLGLWRRLGLASPTAALIHFTEKFNDRFPITTWYRELLDRASRGEYGNMTLCGPMDIKSACDTHAAAIKGMTARGVGHADLLLFPNLTAANTFYKTLALFAHARLAAMLNGALAPVVVPSRADSDESKFYSLALACTAAR